ncbi:MAG TPA: tripartite tricarboxylate transporter substrate binding protein [Burkholderiales bacterium]|nr:tripartite tricarboxylate transporter substrate binding protein [Burkholderiales bacterium]
MLNRIILVILAMASFTGTARAAYPEKPIWWIVPYAVGGSADVVSRILANRISERFNQRILVDNKPGATGAVGAQFVAHAAPDGYTVLYQAFDLAINPLVRQLSFDPMKELTPVTQVVNMWVIMVAPANAPYNTLQEFVDYARKNPDKVNFGTAGAASAGHLTGELFKRQAKLDMVHIPFKGGGPGVTAAIAGQVSVYFATPGSGMPAIQGGRLKALAVAAPKRLAALPNVPTFAEGGYPAVIASEWTGVLVPKGTPSQIVQSLNREIREVLAEPAVAEQMGKLGIDLVTSSPQEFDHFLQQETQRWGKVVRDLNLKYD